MMKKVYFFKLCIVVLGSITFLNIASAQHKVDKKISLSFAMESSGSFVIDNKYGNVEIEGWGEPRISLEMNVTVQHKEKDKAYNLLDRIEPTILEGQSFLNITTTIREKRSSFFNDLLQDLKLDISKTNIDINYKIKLPFAAKIDVVNTFGDIVIENCTGNLTADLSHGSIRLNSLVSFADIKLKFAKLSARDLPNADLNMKNSEAFVTNAKSLVLESSGSDLEIETMDALQLVASRDKIRIGEINSINGNVKYTSVYVKDLNEDMNLTMQLGDLRCDAIGLTDSKIRLEQRSSDIDINIGKAGFILEATMQGGSLRLPESASNISQEYIDEERNHRSVRANFGTNKDGTMIIRGVKGNVVLRDF